MREIPRLLEVEQRHGFRSSWNFVAEDYRIPEGTFDEIRAAGGEVGLHGIKHDGKLFASRARFEADLPKIHRYLADWDAAGFRSPATHRNADWMPDIGSSYDSSFPDTDPFEPQSGGCCSIFPFFLGDMVELPITLVQDHTLFEILRERSIDALDREERVDHPAPWACEPDHPPRLPETAGAAGTVRAVPGLPQGTARTAGTPCPRRSPQWWRLRATLTPGSVLDPTKPAATEFDATPAYAGREAGRHPVRSRGRPRSRTATVHGRS